MSEFELARTRRADRAYGGPAAGQAGSPGFVGQVLSTGDDLQPGKFIRVRIVQVLGDEVQSQPGFLDATTAGGEVIVLLLGPNSPLTGENLLCRFVKYRWVCERRAGGGGSIDFGTIPSCFCRAIPGSLAMTSADPACNFGMFQSCSIRYGDTPAEYAALNLGAKAFISTEDFPDPVAGGARFRYFLTCQFNQFSLTRLYATSPYGSPYRDGVLYTWLIGGVGNTCSPFKLTNGLAFPGSDLSCRVTIE